MTEEEPWLNMGEMFCSTITDKKCYEMFCDTPWYMYRQTGKTETMLYITLRAHEYMAENNITEPEYTQRVIDAQKKLEGEK